MYFNTKKWNSFCDRRWRLMIIEEFLDSMEQCFDDVDQALADANASIPLDYLETRLEVLLKISEVSDKRYYIIFSY